MGPLPRLAYSMDVIFYEYINARTSCKVLLNNFMIVKTYLRTVFAFFNKKKHLLHHIIQNGDIV